MAGRRGRLVRSRPAQGAQAAQGTAQETRGARSMLRRGRRLLRRRGRGDAKPEGALLGYLDFLMTYVQRPEETVRRHAPDARRQVSRPLVAFFLLSFTVASATYALRGRAELPEDNGTVVSGVRGLGQEMLPVAVFLSLLVLAAFLELARITLPKGFQGRAGGASWDGARATLNALLAFAAVLVPAATGAVLAAELTLARLPTAAAGAVLLAAFLVPALLVACYLPASLEAVHPGLHGGRLLGAASLLAVLPWMLTDWGVFVRIWILLFLVSLLVGGAVSLRQRLRRRAAGSPGETQAPTATDGSGAAGAAGAEA